MAISPSLKRRSTLLVVAVSGDLVVIEAIAVSEDLVVSGGGTLVG